MEAIIEMNAERKMAMLMLKTARGQLDGIIRMLEEGRYCVDISNQILAVEALLKKADLEILDQHIHHCVKDAIVNNDRAEEKIDEVLKLFKRTR
jgi:DNA-binding FrmR family transcriptional regulator